MPTSQTPQNITGRQTTAGAAEETVLLSLNGAVAAATVAVAAGSQLVISDVIVNAAATANFRIQQANDGVTFFDLVPLRLPADGNVGQTYGTGITVTGGTAVVVRVRAETTGGAALVGVNLQGTLNMPV
ncbi:MAG TPA: hypothetical protein VJ044_00325 [Candidatus Hodarchaeales archaeon]|nr:hypothetical protein [Candidatus Hodarchaeales archaeon]